MMPNLSGDELVEIMKSDPDLCAIPIVMSTAAASPFRADRMLERGCHAVLAKPLDESSFLAAAAAASTPALRASVSRPRWLALVDAHSVVLGLRVAVSHE